MLASAAAIYGATASPAFGLAHVELDGLHYTEEATVRARLSLTEGLNLFTLATGPLEERLDALPTVADAEVIVRLPDVLQVRLAERVPILVWRVDGRDLLLGADGILFAQLGEDPPSEAAALPVVEDRRAASETLGVGWRLEEVDFDAATRLASLRPVDVGSSSRAIEVTVTDEQGYVVSNGDGGWTAIFGFYTPSLRTPEIIPGQVRLLRSLLSGREATIERVILASESDGTYTEKASPSPSP
jgi:cell division septal protein FtsQ